MINLDLVHIWFDHLKIIMLLYHRKKPSRAYIFWWISTCSSNFCISSCIKQPFSNHQTNFLWAADSTTTLHFCLFQHIMTRLWHFFASQTFLKCCKSVSQAWRKTLHSGRGLSLTPLTPDLPAIFPGGTTTLWRKRERARAEAYVAFYSCI